MIPPRYAASSLVLTSFSLAWLFIHEAKVEHQPNVKRVCFE